MTTKTELLMTTAMTAGFDVARAEGTLAQKIEAAAKALKAEGGADLATKLDSLIHDYGTGYVAQGLFPKAKTLTIDMVAAAVAVRNKGGATSSKTDRRTTAEDTLCGSMRKAQQRLRDRLEVKATDNRGGARQPAKTKTETPAPTPAQVAAASSPIPIAPEALTATDVVHYFQVQAKALTGYAAKAGKKCSPELLRAAQAFAKAVEAATQPKTKG